MNEQELQLLKQCNGVHGSLDEIFKCESCVLLLDKMDEE